VSDILSREDFEAELLEIGGHHDCPPALHCTARALRQHDAAQRARIEELETIANLARRYVAAHAGARVRMQEAEYAREYEDAERALVLALDKEDANGR
jgi:thiamine biosynthesis protein ThiC